MDINFNIILRDIIAEINFGIYDLTVALVLFFKNFMIF